jgi:hypothetical protein
LLNPRAEFALARQFREQGLPLADIFTFASGLYFRGKITYARRFAEADELIRVITTNAGLLDPVTHFTPDGLQAFGEVDISENDPRYHKPLRRDAEMLARQLAKDGVAVLHEIVPSVGSSAPVIRLKHVVLPAPFGPMSPTSSPRSRCRHTPRTAVRPP